MISSSNKSIVQAVVNSCLAHGVNDFVLSPGSRNAPFSIALDEHPEANTLVIHDERSAAFFALGMIQQLNRPVAVVCTSGSAPLNYYPAVAEAYYQCLPLVVISADRPEEWIDQGDGQTIVQRELYKNHIRYSCNFGEISYLKKDSWFVEREMAVAFSMANGNWKGPIHVNVALSEPLYGTQEYVVTNPKRISLVRSNFAPSPEVFEGLKTDWNRKRKMILVGQSPPSHRLSRLLEALAKDTSIAVLTENTSNTTVPSGIPCIDRALNVMNEKEVASYQPEILITVGDAIVSKRIKTFFRACQGLEHWKVGFQFPYMDTFQKLTKSIQATGEEFISFLLKELHQESNVSNFGSRWKQLDYLAKDRAHGFLEKVEFSDLNVYDLLFQFIPEGAHLHMANSSVVRYCQLFDSVPGISYWCNRGTSGIDGSSSTAVGAAFASPNVPHVLITGDLSFFYDSNAFWNKYVPANLRIILINNGGGGIFDIIPGPRNTKQREKYFVASHQFQARELCEGFGLRYLYASQENDLKNAFEELFSWKEEQHPTLLEVNTTNVSNHSVLEDYFRFNLTADK
jgi:2-succinyl-5-enolpyruvyl-6-hydroxy-3-cyclohexene-1-carboxylate synthase